MNMHTTRNRALTVTFFLLLIVALVSACTFGFLDDADLGDGEEGLHSVKTTIEGGYKIEWYNSAEVLQYYAEFYLTGELVNQMQSYSATGILRYSYLYQYDADGNKTLVAYYDSANALAWYQIFQYSGTLVSATAEYDGAGLIQWSRQYAHGTGTLAGRVLSSASFDEDGTLDGCAVYTYNSDAEPKAVSMTAYGLVPCGVSTAPAASAVPAASSASGVPVVFTAVTASSRATRSGATPRARITLVPPSPPEYVLKSMPDQSALDALGVDSYTFWQYDTHGSSELTLTDEWYPTRVSRTDDRIEEAVSMELSWDASHRIERKKSYYGSTLALDVTMSYTDTGLPAVATTTGAAMLLPLEYALTYDGYRPTRLDVSSNGNLLQYFEYDYTNPPTLPGSVEELRTIDPFAFLEELKGATFSIHHFDGDDKLVETFSFSAAGDGLKVDVLDSTGASNGYYLVTYDASGFKASLACFGADNVQQWSYSYGYEDAVADLEDAATAAGIDLDSMGRLAETYIADAVEDGTADYFIEYAKGFVMDLLF